MNFHISRVKNYQLLRHFSLFNNNYQKKNFYDSLGITPKATQSDIKSAYYKLSKIYHPDVNKNNESAAGKFRDITTAYEILGNVKARKIYDRGLLVSGSGAVEDFNSAYDEPVTEKYKHAPFYNHRNKPISKKTTTTLKYDMDEWTKAHYSDTFTKSQSKRENYVKEMEVRRVNEEENALGSQTIILIFLSVCCFLFYSTNSFEDYDKPTSTRANLKSDEKPD